MVDRSKENDIEALREIDDTICVSDNAINYWNRHTGELSEKYAARKHEMNVRNKEDDINHEYCYTCQYCRVDEETERLYCKQTYTEVYYESSACNSYMEED